MSDRITMSAEEFVDIQTRQYTTPEIARLLDESLDKVQSSYVRRGYVTPGIQDASGTGTRRLWNFRNVKQFFVVYLLRKWNWPPDDLKFCVQLANEQKMDMWDEGNIWVWHKSHRDIGFLSAKYNEYGDIIVPSVEDAANLDVLDFEKSAMKFVLITDAVHRQALKQIHQLLSAK